MDVLGLGHVSAFKYFRCVLDESGTDEAEYNRKEASGKRVAGAITASELQLECARVLHETLFVSGLTYNSETLLWKEKERFRIRAVQMDKLRGLLGIRNMDRFPNARIRELCGMAKWLDETIDEGALRWFGHVERIDNDRIAKGST